MTSNKREYAVVKTIENRIISITLIAQAWLRNDKTTYIYPPQHSKNSYKKHVLEKCIEDDTWPEYAVSKIYKQHIRKLTEAESIVKKYETQSSTCGESTDADSHGNKHSKKSRSNKAHSQPINTTQYDSLSDNESSSSDDDLSENALNNFLMTPPPNKSRTSVSSAHGSKQSGVSDLRSLSGSKRPSKNASDESISPKICRTASFQAHRTTENDALTYHEFKKYFDKKLGDFNLSIIQTVQEAIDEKMKAALDFFKENIQELPLSNPMEPVEEGELPETMTNGENCVNFMSSDLPIENFAAFVNMNKNLEQSAYRKSFVAFLTKFRCSKLKKTINSMVKNVLGDSIICGISYSGATEGKLKFENTKLHLALITAVSRIFRFAPSSKIGSQISTKIIQSTDVLKRRKPELFQQCMTALTAHHSNVANTSRIEPESRIENNAQLGDNNQSSEETVQS